jgi:4-amino-4-deoxy-L-arabinose transferase-like glycosyltransferase
VNAATNMTRCLNCGADRDADVCEACGLGSSAAEFSLRSKLLNRTAVFLLGALAFIVASGRYPALDLDEILIFIGILFFLTLGIAIWVEKRALQHAEVEALKRVYYGLIPLPWLLALLLLGNGALDNSRPQIETARVVGKFAMRGPVPSRRLIVTSWREGHHFERVPVDLVDFDRFTTGDIVEVQVKSGLVGIPWVSGVLRP